MAVGGGVELFPRTPSYRVLTPPRPVIVDLDQALARDTPVVADDLPLRVTAGWPGTTRTSRVALAGCSSPVTARGCCTRGSA